MKIFNKWILAAKTHKSLKEKHPNTTSVDLEDFVKRPISDVLGDLLKEQKRQKN